MKLVKATHARNGITGRRHTPQKQPKGDKRRENNLKATHAMKTNYKRHTLEMANWKATHAVKRT